MFARDNATLNINVYNNNNNTVVNTRTPAKAENTIIQVFGCIAQQVMCGTVRPIQSDVQSSQGDVRYSYAHKLVMCGFQADPYR